MAFSITLTLKDGPSLEPDVFTADTELEAQALVIEFLHDEELGDLDWDETLDEYSTYIRFETREH